MTYDITFAGPRNRYTVVGSAGSLIVHNCGYGMGWEKFRNTCRRGALGGEPIILTEDEARHAVGSYRTSHQAVVRLWKYADRVLARLYVGDDDFIWGSMRVCGKYITLPNGASLDYSNLTIADGEYATITRRGANKIYGAKLVENVIQALSRVVLSQAMLKIAPWRRIALCTHDDIVVLARTEEAPEVLAECLQIMKTPPAWCPGIPLDAEGGYDVRYSK